MIGLSNVGGGGAGDVIAFINVTYPSGSICTCTKGTKTLRAKDTTGSYVFSIKEPGDWVVSCTDGDKTASNTVTVAEWTANNITLVYMANYIESGTIITPFTVSGGSISSGSSYAQLSSGGNYGRIAYAPINLSFYNTLTIVLAAGGASYESNDCPAFGVSREIPTIDPSSVVVGDRLVLQRFPVSAAQITSDTYTIDLSSYTGNGYVFLTISGASNLPDATGIMNIVDFYAE